MKLFLYCLIMQFLISSISYGQNSGTDVNEILVKSIEFKTGAAQQKESNLHKKVFNGFNYTFQFSRLKQSKNLSSLNISLGSSHLKTDVEYGFSSVNASLTFDYHYLYPVYSKDKWNVLSGFGSNLNYNVGYFWIWDESHLYSANFLSLNLTQRISYEVRGKRFVTMDLTVPVFLFLSRPETERNFKMDDFSFSGIMNSLHYKPELKFLTRSNFLNVSVNYQYQRNNRLQPSLGYSFNYFNLNTTYSNRAQIVQHLIGLKWYL